MTAGRVRDVLRRSPLWNGRFDDPEAGFTLIEIMVAMVMAMIVLAALAAGIISSKASIRDAEGTDGAVQVAHGAINAAEVGGWNSEGFYQSDTAVQTYQSQPIVILAATAPSPRPVNVPLPTYTVTASNRKYTVLIRITWVKGSGVGTNPPAYPTPPAYGYKRIVAIASWTVAGVVHSITQQAIVAPGVADMQPPGSPPSAVCQTSLQQVGFCGVSITSGYVATVVNAATLPCSVAINFIATTTLVATSMTATYLNSASASTTIPLTSPDGLSWSASLPIGTVILAGAQTVTFNAVVNGSPTSTTFPAVWTTGKGK